jgi:hypothetical protein
LRETVRRYIMAHGFHLGPEPIGESHTLYTPPRAVRVERPMSEAYQARADAVRRLISVVQDHCEADEAAAIRANLEGHMRDQFYPLLPDDSDVDWSRVTLHRTGPNSATATIIGRERENPMVPDSPIQDVEWTLNLVQRGNRWCVVWDDDFATAPRMIADVARLLHRHAERVHRVADRIQAGTLPEPQRNRLRTDQPW